METTNFRIIPRLLMWAACSIAVLLAFVWFLRPQPARAAGDRLITIYYDGIERTVVSDAATIGDVLQRADVAVGPKDAVEPDQSTTLVAPTYSINIYRARLVTVVDGQKRHTVLTPHTSPRKIAADASLTTQDEDQFKLTRITDFVHEGTPGLKLNIDRAIPVVLVLYGKQVATYTQASTVAELLQEKKISLEAQDGLSIDPQTPITTGLTVEVWRNGVQAVTEEQAIDFTIKQIRDASHPVGFKNVQTPGVKGKRMVTYEIEMRNGTELGRKEIQSIIAEQPKEQVEIIGTRPSAGSLSRSKGVNNYVDSKGVAHRETYYDLKMDGVMRQCGGGTYSVREDGAKIDQAGYILVAAHLGNYRRCSIVETSLGLGKVYDTGGFTARHPHGFDLATDWSNNDGR